MATGVRKDAWFQPDTVGYPSPEVAHGNDRVQWHSQSPQAQSAHRGLCALATLAGCTDAPDRKLAGAAGLPRNPELLLRRMAFLVEERRVFDADTVERALDVRIGEGVAFGSGWTRSRVSGWLETPGEVDDYAYMVRSVDIPPGRAPGAVVEEAGLSVSLRDAACVVRPEHIRCVFRGPGWSVSTRLVRISDAPPEFRPFHLHAAEARNRSAVEFAFDEGLEQCTASARPVQNWMGRSPARAVGAPTRHRGARPLPDAGPDAAAPGGGCPQGG